MLANLLLLKRAGGEAPAGKRNSGLVPVWPHANTQGAWDMGVHPSLGPGYTPVAAGLDADAIAAGAADGSVQALFCAGADPIGDGLMVGRGELRFLVVQELFLTLTAEVADVVLPAQSWAEREGTYTNGERRVQRFYPGIEPVGDTRPDWQILAQLGERVGMGKPTVAASLVFKDIAKAVPQYAGMDYRTLARVEEQWPIIGRSDLYYGGTAYDNSQGLGQQWASAAETAAPEAYDVSFGEADAPQPALLLAPSLYTPGTLIDETRLLDRRIVEPTVHLNPADAGQDAMAIFDGELVAVMLADGEMVEAFARIDEDAPPGLPLLFGIRGSMRGSLVAGEVKKRVRAAVAF
jgi:NADH-quinone oxidoreductase subunit G